MKKAQVTIFIIIGIIILIVFMLTFYFISQLSKEPLEDQKLVAAKSKLQSESLRYYVESCVRKAVNDGLMLISNQGGFIFKEQPGSMLQCTLASCTPSGGLELEGWRTPYLINPSQNLVPQNYPYLKFPCASNLSWPYCYYIYDPNVTVEPMIGESSLPELFTSLGRDSIQEQLERYVEYKTNDCIDFGGVTNVTGVPYLIQTEMPITNLTITSYDLRANVRLPLKISGEGSYPVIEFQDYEVIFPVRYGHFYAFVRDLINKEVADPGFDISKFDELPTYWPGFFVHVEKDKQPGDDLVIVRDDQSYIGQKMLEFRFLRKNSPPVLNYVHGAGYSNASDFIIYMQNEIERLDVQPLAFDPDEDVLIYSYRQWGQDYFEKFISDGQSQMLPIQANDKWMKPGYDQYSGAAYLMLNMSRDLGKHKFVIKADDPASMYDMQNVNISILNAAMFAG